MRGTRGQDRWTPPWPPPPVLWWQLSLALSHRSAGGPCLATQGGPGDFPRTKPTVTHQLGRVHPAQGRGISGSLPCAPCSTVTSPGAPTGLTPAGLGHRALAKTPGCSMRRSCVCTGAPSWGGCGELGSLRGPSTGHGDGVTGGKGQGLCRQQAGQVMDVPTRRVRLRNLGAEVVPRGQAPPPVTDGAQAGARRSRSGGVRNPLCCCPAGWRSGRCRTPWES